MTDNKDVKPGEGDAPTELETATALATELQGKLDNQNAAAKRTADAKNVIETQLVDTQAKLDALEKANEEPKEANVRIADLEKKLARSEAVSRHGLSPEDAELLKGSPDEILKDAAYWAERLKENAPDPKKEEGKTNQQIIDEKIEADKLEAANKVNDENGSPKAPKKPDPKKGNLTWLETYKQANPGERYKMDQQVQRDGIDPTK